MTALRRRATCRAYPWQPQHLTADLGVIVVGPDRPHVSAANALPGCLLVNGIGPRMRGFIVCANGACIGSLFVRRGGLTYESTWQDWDRICAAQLEPMPVLHRKEPERLIVRILELDDPHDRPDVVTALLAFACCQLGVSERDLAWSPNRGDLVKREARRRFPTHVRHGW